MSEFVFRADSIRKTFGARTVLSSASLWARADHVTVLLGRNGSGKTTLFRIAAGLLPADQGSIIVDGVVQQRPGLHRLARSGLFYLPERGLLPRNRTAGTLLRIAARACGAEARLDEVIGRLQLDRGVLSRLPDTLSGGERRRAELALPLLRQPRCLLADEPFMGIAPRDEELVAAVLRGIADAGCAVVASGHEVPSLMGVADEVVWVVAGTTHGLGTPAEARRHWQFSREYLGA